MKQGLTRVVPNVKLRKYQNQAEVIRFKQRNVYLGKPLVLPQSVPSLDAFFKSTFSLQSSINLSTL